MPFLRINAFVLQTKKGEFWEFGVFTNKSWLSLTMFRIGCTEIELISEG